LTHLQAGTAKIQTAFLFLLDRIQLGDFVAWGDPKKASRDWSLGQVTRLTESEIQAGLKRFARGRLAGKDPGAALEAKSLERILNVFTGTRPDADVCEHVSRLLHIQPGDQVTWCFQPGDPQRTTEPVLTVEAGEIVTPTKRFLRVEGIESTAGPDEVAWISSVTLTHSFS